MIQISVFLTPLWAYLCYLLLSLLRNYHSAKAIGIPIIISPVNVFHPAWSLIGGFVKPLVLLFPLRWRRWSIFYTIHWPFEDKRRIHEELGDVFAIVNPWNIAVIVADPVTAEAVLHRRKEFIKGKNFSIFDFYGKNVFSVDGEDWSRMRRIVSPIFNERASKSVWEESRRQATAMLEHWKSSSDGVVHSMLDDTRMIALHVLSAVGFGMRQEFGHGMADVKPGHSMAYGDALKGVLNYLGFLMLFSRRTLSLPFAPKAMKEAGMFMREFDSYMDELLKDERQAIENGEDDLTKQNLLSALIQASALERDPKNRLTDEEIKGNLFILNIAGHDTTAHTLAYAIALLSLMQDCQAWIREELEQHTHGKGPLHYDVFPKLKRCQAIMWETLRLYCPVLAAPRLTNGVQILPLSNKTSITIPSNTTVHYNIYSTQINPSAWPNINTKTPLDFHPQRWISTHGSEETLIHPEAGTFLAWSGGPRICLGQKFSQVEFVAVISTIFSKYIVEPAGLPEELERAMRVPDPASPTLSMMKSENVAFRLREISGGDGGEVGK